jgi:AraC-like DNA-binding protein
VNDAAYAEVPAPPPLDSLVESFWFLRGDMDGAPEQVVVPDGRVEIVLHLAEPFALVGEDSVARPQTTALVAGQLTAPIRLAPRGRADVVGIRFHAATAGALLPLSLGEVTGLVASLADVHRRLASALLDAASRSESSRDRVAALSSVIARSVTRPLPTQVLAAASALDAPQPPSIGSLARDLGLTVRTLERRMVHHVGLPPKILHRVLRFRRAFRLLEQVPAGRWDRAAIAAGYFDQAHMIRDFKAFAGAPPSAFFRTDPAFARALMGGDAEREPDTNDA